MKPAAILFITLLLSLWRQRWLHIKHHTTSCVLYLYIVDFIAQKVPLDCMLKVIMNIFISITSQFNFYHMIKVEYVHVWLVWFSLWGFNGIDKTWNVVCYLNRCDVIHSQSFGAIKALSSLHLKVITPTKSSDLRTVKINLQCVWFRGKSELMACFLTLIWNRYLPQT